MKADEFQLPKLLDLLKAKGVRVFRDGELHIEFTPTEPTAPPPQAPPVVEDEKCRCGHAIHQHNGQGQCLVGCELEQCAPPEK